MTWWLKTRLVPTVLAGALLGHTLLLLAVWDWTVVLPSLSIDQRNDIPLAFFLPLLVAGPLAHCLDSRQPHTELAGIRRIALRDTLLAVSAVGLSLLLTVLAACATQSDITLQAARNVLFVTGLMLTARAVLGRSGIVVPLLWIFTVVLFGRRSTSTFYSWAVTALPSDTAHAAAAAALLFITGICATYLTARKLP
ncbi:hypothetical protein [Streptomyces sp. NPDC005012]|uniref:hypothetical protein n=1 Tax=Streptomyces sp. NPDC005012 TaxID=3154558 RepID=UPI0033A2A424